MYCAVLQVIMTNYASSPTNVDQEVVTTSLSDVTDRQLPQSEMSTESMTYSCLCYDFIIEAVLMGALCIFGFAGNSVSTVCLWRDRSKSATPFLLISLGFADTLFLVTVFAIRVIPSIDTFAMPLSWLKPAVPYLGKYVYPTAIVAETGTVYLTILVTLNRYVSVCWPYRASELCTPRSARAHVAAVFLFAVLYNLPRYFEYRIVSESSAAVAAASYATEVSDDVTVGIWNSTAFPSNVAPNPSTDAALLDTNWNNIDANISHLNVFNVTSHYKLMTSPEVLIYEPTWLKTHPAYRLIYSNLLYFLVIFLFPLISLTFLNQRLIAGLRRTRKKRARMRGGGGRRLQGVDSTRSEEDITLMLIVVVIVFVVTQTPAAVTQTVVSTLDLSHLICPSPFFYYERLSDLLVVTNSSVNFIIYCLCSRRFRDMLMKLVCGQRNGTPQDGSTAGQSAEGRQGRAELQPIRPIDCQP